MNVIKLNRRIVSTCNILVCMLFLWGWSEGLANFTHPAHPAPIAGQEWKDINSTSHNHNTIGNLIQAGQGVTIDFTAGNLGAIGWQSG